MDNDRKVTTNEMASQQVSLHYCEPKQHEANVYTEYWFRLWSQNLMLPVQAHSSFNSISVRTNALVG
nr:unnamed protein product [Fasciola hepatica]